MRIVIDLQGAQTESRFRGIGRYSLSLAQAIARNRGEHEILIALNALFPETIQPIRSAFDGLLPSENIRVWHALGPVRECQTGNSWRRVAAEKIREAFLASLKPDLVYVSSLFEGYVDDAVTSLGLFPSDFPTVITLYDLIPLLNPERYFASNPSYEEHYRRKLEFLRRATGCVAISESSAKEGVKTLNMPEETITNISTACDPVFRRVERHLELPFSRFGITKPFILNTGGAEERKNLPRLIHAFSLLPAEIRERYQLVLAGKMPEDVSRGLADHAMTTGLRPEDCIFTGYIPDDDLVELYNRCSLFVFPSWHEGFGLPPLEAMNCGAPVIGAETSSLPEVIGWKEALFDPSDTKAITRKIERALTDEQFRRKLIENGETQSKRFSWDESARKAITFFECIISMKAIRKKITSCDWQAHLSAMKQIDAVMKQFLSESMERNAANSDDVERIAHYIAKNAKQADALARRKILPESIYWRIEGPFDSSYSLSLLNRETARALTELGHNVALHSTEGFGDFAPKESFLNDNPRIAALHRRSAEMRPEIADVTSRNLYPPRVHDMTSRLNLLHHYAWEETAFPSDWVENFNDSLQGMTALSRHVEKLLIDNGVFIPIETSGCGVDHWERVTSDTRFVIRAKTFRFLHVSSCFPRKGADVLLDAYGQAFSAEDDVSLVIKTFSNPHNEIHRWLEEAQTSRSKYPDVVIIEDDLTESELKALYEQCHALVAPSRAEGFGLPLAEAMLSGLPVITTGWSGQTDFCNEETAWLVDFSFAYAKSHFALFNSVWAEPDAKHLAETMKHVYACGEDERKARSLAGRKLLMENYRWTDAVSRLVSFARRCSEGGGQEKRLRIGWVSTWNSRCGIAAYSADLLNKMPEDVLIFADNNPQPLQADETNVKRCWNMDGMDDLARLAEQIDVASVDVLVIQWNYGFFNFTHFLGFLERQMREERVVVIELHSTQDPQNKPEMKLIDLVPMLKECRRVLVHSVSDLNRLKTNGLVQNVALFPLGMIGFEGLSQQEVAKRDFRVSSFGFFLPHKGLLELIESVRILRSNGVNVKLQMINAEYPAPESQAIIQRAMKIIQDSNLTNSITMRTDFLEENLSLKMLAESDLIVFPYQETGESASAAVRFGIASGAPVAVTPLPIFDDVSPAVFQLPGTSPEDMAFGIAKLMNDIRLDVKFYQEKMKQAEAWRSCHRFEHMSRRLSGMLRGLVSK